MQLESRRSPHTLGRAYTLTIDERKAARAMRRRGFPFDDVVDTIWIARMARAMTARRLYSLEGIAINRQAIRRAVLAMEKDA
jgi:hypothetical protein